MCNSFFNSFKKYIIFFICFILLFSYFSFPSFANSYLKEAEERKYLEIQSNNYKDWPFGPSIGAEAAILMDANTGAILYEKNIHEKLYPASITKLLTSYIAVNECQLSDNVLFSQDAVTSINWWEDANMAVNPGTVLSVKDVLSGILIGSANEAAYAIAEHISGDVTTFSSLMNETAKELGCKNSNFVNPNGIHDENHYTTAYDMALIARAFFSDEFLSKLSGTLQFQVPVNSTQKKENIILNAKSQLLPGKPYSYDPLIGTKTGYTEYARQTLVSCAEKNGMKLICVILKEEMPFQFSDTVELFNYGFDNFTPFYLSDVNNSFEIRNSFFTTSFDILGNSNTILSLNTDDYIILPNTVSLEDLTSKVSYNNNSSNVCSIEYFHNTQFLGSIDVIFNEETSTFFDFHSQYNSSVNDHTPIENNIILINISHIILLIFFILICISILSLLCNFFNNKRGKLISSGYPRKSRFLRRRNRKRKF